MALLSVRNLTTMFATERGEVSAVDDLSFEVAAGEVVGLVGESGSGKSVTALSIMRLLPQPPARIAAGEIWFDGQDLVRLPEAEMRRLRGGAVAMIFQEPMTSLNPVFTIGDQLMESIRVHHRLGPRARRQRAVEMLAKVGIAAPDRRLDDYPHQLSGGMRQRVMIAMALAGAPKLLIADEPTTALDVTIQAQILALLQDLAAELGMAVLMITHNMGVVAELADRVIVLYAGRMVEAAPVDALFEAPAHPYTRGLLNSIPAIGDDRDRLVTIPGALPDPRSRPPGCRFEPRCPLALPACQAAPPPLVDVGTDHRSACLRAGEAAWR